MLKKWILNIGVKCYRCVQHCVNAASVGVQGIVLNSQNECLLVEQTYSQGWCLPGGGVKSGETPIQGLKRELLEEVGIEIIGQPTLFQIYHQNCNGIDDYPIVYIVREYKEHYIKLPNLEIQRSCWFKLEHLPIDMNPASHRRLLEISNLCPVQSKW